MDNTATPPAPENKAKLMMKRMGFVFLYLITFIIGTVIVFPWIEPDPITVDINNPPDHFPLLVAWKDDKAQPHCQIFTGQEMARLRREVPEIRLNLTLDDLTLCQTHAIYLAQHKKWPITFQWQTPPSWFYPQLSMTQVKAGQTKIDISFPPKDNYVNKGHYYSDADGIHDIVYRYYHSPVVSAKAFGLSLAINFLLWSGGYIIVQRRKKTLPS